MLFRPSSLIQDPPFDLRSRWSPEDNIDQQNIQAQYSFFHSTNTVIVVPLEVYLPVLVRNGLAAAGIAHDRLDSDKERDFNWEVILERAF